MSCPPARTAPKLTFLSFRPGTDWRASRLHRLRTHVRGVQGEVHAAVQALPGGVLHRRQRGVFGDRGSSRYRLSVSCLEGGHVTKLLIDSSCSSAIGAIRVGGGLGSSFDVSVMDGTVVFMLEGLL